MKEKLKEIAKSHTLNWYQLSDHVKASIQEAYRAGWEARGEKDASKCDDMANRCVNGAESHPKERIELNRCATTAQMLAGDVRSLRMEE